MEFAMIKDVASGDTLRTDDGFTCLEPFEEYEVKEDDNGLYIECSEGHHYLDGQIHRNVYIGLQKVA
jgi:hypothetical protein